MWVTWLIHMSSDLTPGAQWHRTQGQAFPAAATVRERWRAALVEESYGRPVNGDMCVCVSVCVWVCVWGCGCGCYSLWVMARCTSGSESRAPCEWWWLRCVCVCVCMHVCACDRKGVCVYVLFCVCVKERECLLDGSWTMESCTRRP